MILIAALAVSFISVPRRASGQLEPLQQSTNPAQANAQGLPAAPNPLSPAEQKKRDEWMTEPYRVAAAVVAVDLPTPKSVVTVGGFQGQFLEVFLDQFPTAHGKYTEDIRSSNPPIARKRLARFGDRVTYEDGCPSRDISTGCVPKGTDIIITEWMSIHQDLDGMYKNYRAAAEHLNSGGWVAVLDHVSFGGTSWDSQLQVAGKGFRPQNEVPPIHHPNYRVPTAEEELGAMRAAGFDAQVVWQSFSTVLLMGHKR
jgi:hypothetical protein